MRYIFANIKTVPISRILANTALYLFRCFQHPLTKHARSTIKGVEIVHKSISMILYPKNLSRKMKIAAEFLVADIAVSCTMENYQSTLKLIFSTHLFSIYSSGNWRCSRSSSGSQSKASLLQLGKWLLLSLLLLTPSTIKAIVAVTCSATKAETEAVQKPSRCPCCRRGFDCFGPSSYHHTAF